MSIEHVLAVIPVTNLDRSLRWYEGLFGRAPDNTPMPNLVEWQVIPRAWVQVFIGEENAGRAAVNIAVDDLDAHIVEVEQRGLEPGPVVEANKGVRLSLLTDPDGNQVQLVGSFRVRY